MFWQEEESDQPYLVPDTIQDLSFAMEWRTLPVDHAYALLQAIGQQLPWFPTQAGAGLHIVHGADSGNGWDRPEGADQLLYLSRRTRLTLRLPKERLSDAQALSGKELVVAGHLLQVGRASAKPLTVASTLYARYVVVEEGESEEQFTTRAVAELRALGIKFKKVLCGKSHRLAMGEGSLDTRSLMVADLPQEDSIHLQERGMGPHRTLGCGLFIPHKALK